MNPYDLLLPHWERFCLARWSVHPEKDASNWLYTTGARQTMVDALKAWGARIDEICGPYTTVEWPEAPRRRMDGFFDVHNEEYVPGPCIVAGCLLFTDENSP